MPKDVKIDAETAKLVDAVPAVPAGDKEILVNIKQLVIDEKVYEDMIAELSAKLAVIKDKITRAVATGIIKP